MGSSSAPKNAMDQLVQMEPHVSTVEPHATINPIVKLATVVAAIRVAMSKTVGAVPAVRPPAALQSAEITSKPAMKHATMALTPPVALVTRSAPPLGVAAPAGMVSFARTLKYATAV
jgi:hypothetical protein